MIYWASGAGTNMKVGQIKQDVAHEQLHGSRVCCSGASTVCICCCSHFSYSRPQVRSGCRTCAACSKHDEVKQQIRASMLHAPAAVEMKKLTCITLYESAHMPVTLMHSSSSLCHCCWSQCKGAAPSCYCCCCCCRYALLGIGARHSPGRPADSRLTARTINKRQQPQPHSTCKPDGAWQHA
jgi:hypothetical protein